MQFVAKETGMWLRRKNAVVHVKLSADDVQFQQRLHAKERLPERHIRCFVQFRNWLGEHMGNTTSEIEKMAMKPPLASEYLYRVARHKWYEKCLLQADILEAKTANRAVEVGCTDSSEDIIKDSTTASKDEGKKAQKEARSKANRAIAQTLSDATKEAKDAELKEKSGLQNIGKSGEKTADGAEDDDDDDPSPQEKAVMAVTGTKETVEEETEVEIAANSEADARTVTPPNNDSVVNGTIGEIIINSSNASFLTNSTSDPKTNNSGGGDICWKEKAGTGFVFEEVECTEQNKVEGGREDRRWDEVINGERRPETEGAKLMSVVGPIGCVGHKLIGGNKATYWGGLTAPDNVTIPCRPSGEPSSYLSPEGGAAKVAIDLIRAAEAEEAREFAELMAASQTNGNLTLQHMR